MFPYLYEFRWAADHIVFISIFSIVVLIVASTLVLATVRTARRLRSGAPGEPGRGQSRADAGSSRTSS